MPVFKIWALGTEFNFKIVVFIRTVEVNTFPPRITGK